MTKPDHTTGSPATLDEHAADGQGRDDAGVLLALEPQAMRDIENARENPALNEDLNPSSAIFPLLGTICSPAGVHERPQKG